MLLLDVPRICADKGIAHPKKFLLGLGFYPKAALDILKRKRVRLDYDQLEKLCLALRCTPNDLFAWMPGAEAAIEAGHPMMVLKRAPKPSITDMLQTMNGAQIDALRAVMEAQLAGGQPEGAADNHPA